MEIFYILLTFTKGSWDFHSITESIFLFTLQPPEAEVVNIAWSPFILIILFGVLYLILFFYFHFLLLRQGHVLNPGWPQSCEGPLASAS